MRGELFDRAFDPQAARVHGPDNVGVGIADQHIMAAASKAGRYGAADRAAAEDGVSHGVHVTTQ